MTERDAILKADHLSLWIKNDQGDIPILRDITFTICKGERWGIAGESGAGKSMTMNAIAALLPAGAVRMEGDIWYHTSDGWIRLGEVSAGALRRFVAKQTAIIFQDSINALNPNERIRKQWAQTLRLNRPDLTKEQMEAYLCERMEDFGIRGGPETLRQYPDQLSGGMRQRIAIAMALESRAPILIADEPTTSLDAITQRATVDLIREVLDKTGQTLLYISHNLGILQYLCDHVMVFNEGCIVEQGEADQVFFSPEADYTKQLIEETRKIMGDEDETR